MIRSISQKDAQKLVLHSQLLSSTRSSASAIHTTLSTIEHLMYVQIDTISVVQRAHHHTLWTRNPQYTNAHIDELLEQKQIFEYWSHAAAYLPIKDFRYSLLRKKAIAEGEQDHWYERDKNTMAYVLNRIRDEGPLMSKDFECKKKTKGEWYNKPTKIALEYLFMQGELMIPRRENFHKVYDLSERVLPKGVDLRLPTQDEYSRFLITGFLKANGLGNVNEISYLKNNTKGNIKNAVKDMLSAGEIVQIKVNDRLYYALPDSLNLLQKPLLRSRARILSPFDNVVIQRKRIQELFDFHYILECYTPKEKRKYGYFLLPVLWDGELVARMDCNADTKTKVLHINHLAIEPKLKKTDAFFNSLRKELSSFMVFNACKDIKVHKMSPEISTLSRII
jgi:hypothetical protein